MTERKFKAVSYIKQKQKNGRETYEERYVIVDTETGEVLDDAQGYGYKTPQKAYAAFGYKNRDKSKDAEKKAKEEHIRKWLKQHGDFSNLMEAFAFDIQTGRDGNETFNAKFVKEMLEDNDLHPDFTAGDLLKVWMK